MKLSTRWNSMQVTNYGKVIVKEGRGFQKEVEVFKNFCFKSFNSVTYIPSDIK